MQAIQVDDGEIGLLAHFQRANLMLQTKRAGAVDGCHLQHALGRHNQWIVGNGFVQNRRQLHFANQIVVVVARPTIAAQGHVDAAGQHLGNFAYARCQFTIGRRIMRNVGARLREFSNILIVKPDHMHQHTFRPQQTHALSKINGRKSIFFL